MTKLGMEEGDSLEHPLLSKAIENAQRKVEQMHFEIRKQLLSYDNVMNEQREAVYRERGEILSEENMIDRVWDILEDTAASAVDSVFENRNEEPDIQAAAVRLKGLFWPGIEKHLDRLEDQTRLDEVRAAVVAEVRNRFDEKKENLGEETSNNLFRFILLHVLDDLWKEHLLAMDELRRGIGLRAIGQKDPLLEYRFESFALFQKMLESAREEVTSLALRVEVVSERKERKDLWQERRDGFLPGQMQDSSPEPEKMMPVQRMDKIGRNDPCPCGSGKKYKHCCGRDITGRAEA